jgi:N-acetylglucosamine malate deacetylase 1
LNIASIVRTALRSQGVHPRRWLAGKTAYSRYLGYIRPHLLLSSSAAEFHVRRQLLAYGWEPRQLTAPVGKRILVLCPHPDDESIGPGGLLLAHRDLAEIHLVCLCNGAAGGSLNDGNSNGGAMIEVRRAEFRKTASDLRAASIKHLDYDDGKIPTSAAAAQTLRSVVIDIRPDVVLLPWFLDNHVDHRTANILYSRACADLETIVLGYEIWSMLEPNAAFDITNQLEGKISLIHNYPSQLRTVDYAKFVSGLANVRAFQMSVRPLRSGAAEAFVALPNREYCKLVNRLHHPDRETL